MFAFTISGELVREYAERLLRSRRRLLVCRPRPDEATIGELARIGAALQRLERGSLGRCEVCHELIDPQVRFAPPAAERCDSRGST